jgi:hypothetical protein
VVLIVFLRDMIEGTAVNWEWWELPAKEGNQTRWLYSQYDCMSI